MILQISARICNVDKNGPFVCKDVEFSEDRILGSEQDSELMGDFLPGKGTAEEAQKINVTKHVTEAFPPAFIMSCVGDFCLPCNDSGSRRTEMQ